ncbi:MAG: hypothetical protein HWN51_04205 [Desulfobacterales bacterium]|nr:hypothetical protein [Desulfobacterales bacterium]
MPEVLDKEAVEFLTRFFGGAVSALTENAFVYYAQTHPELFGQFPYNRPMEQLPYWYRLIVGGISIGEALAGLGIEEDPLKLGLDLKTKEFGKGLRKFGEGGVLYTAPMLTSRTIVKNIPPGTVAARGRGQQRRQPASRQGRVIKL